MTSMPASRNALHMTSAPLSWPSSPSLLTRTRIGFFCCCCADITFGDWLFHLKYLFNTGMANKQQCVVHLHARRSRLLLLRSSPFPVKTKSSYRSSFEKDVNNASFLSAV